MTNIMAKKTYGEFQDAAVNRFIIGAINMEPKYGKYAVSLKNNDDGSIVSIILRPANRGMSIIAGSFKFDPSTRTVSIVNANDEVVRTKNFSEDIYYEDIKDAMELIQDVTDDAVRGIAAIIALSMVQRDTGIYVGGDGMRPIPQYHHAPITGGGEFRETNRRRIF